MVWFIRLIFVIGPKAQSSKKQKSEKKISKRKQVPSSPKEEPLEEQKINMQYEEIKAYLKDLSSQGKILKLLQLSHY